MQHTTTTTTTTTTTATTFTIEQFVDTAHLNCHFSHICKSFTSETNMSSVSSDLKFILLLNYF
jgi:hypothetical protein